MNNITTIKLNKKTKGRLENLRTHKRETYDEVIQKMLNILNICKASPEQARIRLRNIDRIRIMSKQNKSSSVKSSDPQHNPQQE